MVATVKTGFSLYFSQLPTRYKVQTWYHIIIIYLRGSYTSNNVVPGYGTTWPGTWPVENDNNDCKSRRAPQNPTCYHNWL